MLTVRLSSSLINSTPSVLICCLPHLLTSLFSLHPALRACQVPCGFSLCSLTVISPLSCFNHPDDCEWQHLMGHTSFALLKLAHVDVKQQRQAPSGIEKSHTVTVVERRGPNAAENEVLSHKTLLKRRNVIPICNFIIEGPTSPTPAAPPPLRRSALSENTVIKKHLTFL